VAATVMLIGNFDRNFPVFLGLIGISIIGVFSLSKKKKWIASKK
jgi:energy-converting hydrogenase Eha subunit H